MVVLLAGGLLVDRGIAINARERAADVAQQAARAGANDLNVAALRSGTVELDPGACNVANAFVGKYTGIGATPAGCTPVQVNGHPGIKVSATVTVHPQFLGLFGSQQLPTRRHTARPHRCAGSPREVSADGTPDSRAAAADPRMRRTAADVAAGILAILAWPC